MQLVDLIYRAYDYGHDAAQSELDRVQNAPVPKPIVSVSAESLRPVFRPSVYEFNKLSSFIVVDSPATTQSIERYEVDISKNRGLVGPEDEAFSVKTGSLVDYNDRQYQRERKVFLDNKVLRLSSAIMLTSQADDSIKAHGLNLWSLEYYQGTKEGQAPFRMELQDIVVVATAEENLFGRFAAHGGEVISRSGCSDEIEIFMLRRPRWYDVFQTKSIFLPPAQFSTVLLNLKRIAENRQRRFISKG